MHLFDAWSALLDKAYNYIATLNLYSLVCTCFRASADNWQLQPLHLGVRVRVIDGQGAGDVLAEPCTPFAQHHA
jgi:hypothetical protein